MPIQDVQTNKQHPVPQNFMSVEFKLIGDLTMRQFIYLLIFGGLAYFIYSTFIGFFKWPLITLFSLIGVLLAWVKIQDRGMDEWIVNYFRAVYSPSQMVWRKEPMDLPMFSQQGIEVVKQELITLAPTLSRRKLEEFLKVQENTGPVDRLDIPEKEFILKVRQAFSQVSVAVDTVETVPFETPVLEEPSVITSQPISDDLKNAQEVDKKPLMPSATVDKAQKVVTQKPKQLETHSSYNSVVNITPDMHSGRRFVSLLPSQGQINLPIRGERVIQTTEEVDIEKDIKDKADQLQALLEQIKTEAGISPVLEVSADISAEKVISEKAKETAEKIQEEKDKIGQEINKLTEELKNSSAPISMDKQSILDELKRKQREASDSYANLQRQISDLQKSLETKKEIMPEDTSVNVQAKPMVQAKITSLTDKPNVISGIVLDPLEKVIEGAIVLVRNQKKEPVVALKTNSVGEFLISSPLSNGVYTVEVGNTDSQYEFDKISVEVKGEILPPILISGKVK